MTIVINFSEELSQGYKIIGISSVQQKVSGLLIDIMARSRVYYMVRSGFIDN